MLTMNAETVDIRVAPSFGEESAPHTVTRPSHLRPQAYSVHMRNNSGERERSEKTDHSNGYGKSDASTNNNHYSNATSTASAAAASAVPYVTDRRSEKFIRNGSKSARHTSSLREPIIQLMARDNSAPSTPSAPKVAMKMGFQEDMSTDSSFQPSSLQDVFVPIKYSNYSSSRSGVLLPNDDSSFSIAPEPTEHSKRNEHRHHSREHNDSVKEDFSAGFQVIPKATNSDVQTMDSSPSSDRSPVNGSPTPPETSVKSKQHSNNAQPKSSNSNSSKYSRSSRTHTHIAVLPNKQETFFKPKTSSNEHLNNVAENDAAGMEMNDLHSSNTHHFVPRPPHLTSTPYKKTSSAMLTFSNSTGHGSVVSTGEQDHEDVVGEASGSSGNSMQSSGGVQHVLLSTSNTGQSGQTNVGISGKVTSSSAVTSSQGLPPKVVMVPQKKAVRSTSSAHSSKRPLPSRYLIKTDIPNASDGSFSNNRHDDVTTDEGGESNIEEEEQFPVLKRYHSLRSMGSNEIISITGGVSKLGDSSSSAQTTISVSNAAVPKICGRPGDVQPTASVPSSSALKTTSNSSRASPSKVTFNMPEDSVHRKKSESFRSRARKGQPRHTSSPVFPGEADAPPFASNENNSLSTSELRREVSADQQQAHKTHHHYQQQHHRHTSPASQSSHRHPPTSSSTTSSSQSQFVQQRDKRDICSPESCAKVHEQFLSQTTYFLNSQLERLKLFQEGKHSWETYREMTLQSLRMTEHAVQFILNEFEKTTESTPDNFGN